MNFLVTNDDGIFAPGVKALVEVLENFGKVFVVCPDVENSAISHSITLRRPISVTELYLFNSNQVASWSISGTPSDCVKLALEVLIKEPIDIVFAGINMGSNIGRDVFYSGTISAALEARLFNLPSVALSLDSYNPQETNFSNCKKWLFQFLSEIFKKPLNNNVLLNVNFPYVELDKFKGFRIADLDFSIERYKHVTIDDSFGQIFYWLKDRRSSIVSDYIDCDFMLIKQGYATITPIQYRFTSNELIENYKNELFDKQRSELK